MEGRLVHSEVEWAGLVSGSYSGLGFSQYKRDSGREIQMATKKQKREAAMARREAYLAEVKADGLKALERDRQWRDSHPAHHVEANVQDEEYSEEAKKNLAAISRSMFGPDDLPRPGVTQDEVDKAVAFAKDMQEERTDPFPRGGTTLPVGNDQNYMDQARNFARAMYIGSTD